MLMEKGQQIQRKTCEDLEICDTIKRDDDKGCQRNSDGVRVQPDTYDSCSAVVVLFVFFVPPWISNHIQHCALLCQVIRVNRP